MQQMGTQQFQQLITPSTQPHQPTQLPQQNQIPQQSPQGQPSYSWEEIDDALQGDIPNQPDLGENYNVWQINTNKAPMALNTLLNEHFQKHNIALLQEPPLSKNALI